MRVIITYLSMLFLSMLLPTKAKLQVNNQEINIYINKVCNLYDKDEMYKKLDSLNSLKNLTPENSVRIKIYYAKESLRIKKYSECLTACYEGIAIAKKNELDSFHIAFYKLLGSESYYTRKLPAAITFTKQALIMATEKNIIEIQAACCQNIGGMSLDMFLIDSTQKNQLDTSYKYLNLAIQKSSVCGDKCKKNRLMSMRLLASLYDAKKDYTKANKLYETVEIETAAFKDTMLMATVLVAHANTLFLVGDRIPGIKKTEEAVDLMRKYKSRNDATFVLTLKYLAKRREEAGRNKEASTLKSEVIELQETMYKAENQAQINELETKFKVKELEQEKDLAKANVKTEKQQKQILLLSILGLVMLVLLGVLGIYLKNKKRETHQQQQLTKAIINAEESERKRIASDLHDGVGQMFSAVKMNLAGLIGRIDLPKDEDRFLAEKTLALVDESCKEVRVISHKMMPNFLLKSGIASDIRSFIEKIDEQKLKITFETNGFSDQLEYNEEVILYRVIQELINNVIKHAQANELRLSLEKTNKHIQVKVADNGKGFNYENALAKGGLGLKNILVRIEYLKGTINFTPNIPKGTIVIINIPIV